MKPMVSISEITSRRRLPLLLLVRRPHGLNGVEIPEDTGNRNGVLDDAGACAAGHVEEDLLQGLQGGRQLRDLRSEDGVLGLHRSALLRGDAKDGN